MSTSPMDEPSQPEGQGNAPTVLDSSDKLVSALQLCFSELARKQEEQAERLQKAVEALRPQAPISDTKTAFWNSYMKLADEHDNEFHQKYGTDLDTALIFAGLFSAVSSAFIIQVQSALSGPHLGKIIAAEILLYISLFTTLLTALLAVLGKQWVMYYHAAGSKGSVEQRGLERQRKLDGLIRWKFDMVLQTFPLLLQLALLVFSAALSIYLWTVNILIASAVLAMTVSGFIGYLFLLSTTIFFEDSPFQNPLAPIISHTFRFLFIHGGLKKLQNSLWHLWAVLQSRFQYKPSEILPSTSPAAQSPSAHETGSELWDPDAFTPPSLEAPAVLWVLETSMDPHMVTMAAEMVLQLQWALDSNVAGAMESLLEIYKSCFQLRSDGFRWDVLPGLTSRAISCGEAYCILGHIAQVSTTTRSLDHYTEACPYGVPSSLNDPDTSLELDVVFQVAAGMDFNFIDWQNPRTIRWATYVYPSSPHAIYASENKDQLEGYLNRLLDNFSTEKALEMDPSTFANYLCSINSCFQRLDSNIVAQLNKSPFREALLTHLLTTLTAATGIDFRLILKLVITTAHWNKVSIDPKHPNQNTSVALHEAVLRFCRFFPREDGWLDVVMAATSLAIVDDYEALRSLHKIDTFPPPSVQLVGSQDLKWIYIAFEQVEQTWGNIDGLQLDSEKTRLIRGLLQILASTGDPPDKPPLSVLRVVLCSFSFGRECHFLAFVALHQMRTWLTDPEFEQMIHKAHVWPELGKDLVFMLNIGGWRYCEMVFAVAKLPQWRPLIHAELPTWLSAYALGWDKWYSPDTFISITRTVWAPTLPDGIPTFTNEFEECWALTLAALSQVWRDVDFTDSAGLGNWARLARSTVQAAFKTAYFGLRGVTEPFSPDLRAICCPHLGKALIQASANARRSIPDYRQESGAFRDPEQVLGHFADFLDEFSQKMLIQSLSGRGVVQLNGKTRDYFTWNELQGLFYEEISGWEDSLKYPVETNV